MEQARSSLAESNGPRAVPVSVLVLLSVSVSSIGWGLPTAMGAEVAYAAVIGTVSGAAFLALLLSRRHALNYSAKSMIQLGTFAVIAGPIGALIGRGDREVATFAPFLLGICLPVLAAGALLRRAGR